MMNEIEFRGLLERHRRSLEAFCMRVRRSEGDWEDLLQDIVIRAWLSRDGFRGEASFGTWLYDLSRSVFSTNYIRKKRIETIYPDHLPDVEELCEDDQEALQHLKEAVQRLNENDQNLIGLYLEERSYKEIALATNTTEKNVASRVMRAKEKLRKFLKGRL